MELKEIVAKELVNILYIGAELGFGNSSLRGQTREQYYELNKEDWNNRAECLIKHILKSHPESAWERKK